MIKADVTRYNVASLLHVSTLTSTIWKDTVLLHTYKVFFFFFCFFSFFFLFFFCCCFFLFLFFVVFFNLQSLYPGSVGPLTVQYRFKQNTKWILTGCISHGSTILLVFQSKQSVFYHSKQNWIAHEKKVSFGACSNNQDQEQPMILHNPISALWKDLMQIV